MSKKLPQIFFYTGIVSMLVLLFQDFLFFKYVEVFNNLEYSFYLKIDNLIENSIALLIFPASYVLFHLLKLPQRKGKIKLTFYLLFGLILPLVFIRAFEPTPGQLSYDYTTFSEITLQRLYLKFILLTVVTFYLFMPLSDILVFLKNRRNGLREFGITLSLGIGSLIIAFMIFAVSKEQTFALLNRLMLGNKVEATLPNPSQLTNQQIVIADYPKPVIECYLKQNPKDLSAKILNQISGEYLLENLGYNSYYLNNHCLVVYIGAPLSLTVDEDPTSEALLSEFLIRHFYNKWIQLNADKHPANTVKINGEEAYKKGIERGNYDSETNTITLNWGYDRIFETITHELLHSFATDHKSPLGDFESGLGEAITEYLTSTIMNHMAVPYKLHIYEDQVHAFEKLLKYSDEDTVFGEYFNGDLRSLQKTVDSKTYSGAYCRFNHYLDKSIVEYNQKKNYKLAKDYAAKSIQALKTKEDDGLDCF